MYDDYALTEDKYIRYIEIMRIGDLVFNLHLTRKYDTINVNTFKVLSYVIYCF